MSLALSRKSRVHIIRFSEAPPASTSGAHAPGKTNPLHPLNASLRQYIVQQLQEAVQDPRVSSIVLLGSERNFSAGADLQELSKLTSESPPTGMSRPSDPSFQPSLQSILSSPSSMSLLDVIAALDACPKPTVALIAGSCLGGGLELALACHWRVCLPSARLGLPEVQVGLIPGAGGTQRLPRLVGLPEALSLILTGRSVGAAQALRLGLVDGVVQTNPPQDSHGLDAVATQWARWAETMPRRRVSQLPFRESLPEAHVMLQSAALSLPRHAGTESVRAALAAIRAGVLAESFEQGMQEESQQFLATLVSPQGKARRHAFFAVREAQKMRQAPPTNHPLLQKDVTNVETAVIGAGTMGSGIALVLLRAGFQVVLVDVQEPALKRGMDFMRRTIEAQVKQGKLKGPIAQSMMQRLRSTMSLHDLGSAQLVVEAAIEKMQIKQSIFKTLKQVAPSALLVSNTSTLDVDAMGCAAGWHFFSPAHVMQLVEIVQGKNTKVETVAILQALTKRLGKIGVVVGNCDGFCGNRLLKPYQAETVMLLVERQTKRPPTVPEVDAALVNFGMALGPFQLSDLAGNDVGYNIRKERGWVRMGPTGAVPSQRPSRYSELPDLMVSELGRLGQKAGKGWYDYDASVGKGRVGLPSPEIDAFIRRFMDSHSTSGLEKMSEQEIIDRVLFPLVNEGFKCLEEGIVRRPSDIDVIYLYGYGFPVWKGGPMYWAEHDIGLAKLLRSLRKMSETFPGTDHFVPSKLLELCVQRGLPLNDCLKLVIRSKL